MPLLYVLWRSTAGTVIAKPECFPCVFRQVHSAAKQVGADDEKTTVMLVEAARLLSTMDLKRSPAEISFDCLKRAYEIPGDSDPFAEQKREQNARVLKHYDRFAQLIRESDDPLKTAMLLAIAGNVIDTGIGPGYDFDDTVRSVLERGFAVDDSPKFREALRRSRNLLYLLDNSGEVVLDRLLIERFTGVDVTCVVRRSPIINDVTAEDARHVGIDRAARIIDPGIDALGVPLSGCSPGFQKIFRDADIIISKGQANFETLDEYSHRDEFRGRLFFLTLAKCECIAEIFGAKVGEAVFKQA